VAESEGSHIYDTLTRELSPVEQHLNYIVDPGPRTLPYRYKLVYPDLMDLPESLDDDTIILKHKEEKLKGLINIHNVANWCQMKFVKSIDIELSLYSFTSKEPIALTEVATVKNKEISIIKEFNKYLFDSMPSSIN
jgi:hypothetical protein